MAGTRKKAQVQRHRPRIEEIEPRILYSADINPGLLDAAPLPSVAQQRTLDAGGEFVNQSAVQAAAQQTRYEIVFVDTATPDYQRLVDDIKSQSGSDRRIDVFLLDAQRDGIEQISSVLADQQDISAVHLISHGGDGEVQLGGSTLNFDSLLKNAGQIKDWGRSLSVGRRCADLRLRRCPNRRRQSADRCIVAIDRR